MTGHTGGPVRVAKRATERSRTSSAGLPHAKGAQDPNRCSISDERFCPNGTKRKFFKAVDEGGFGDSTP